MVQTLHHRDLNRLTIDQEAHTPWQWQTVAPDRCWRWLRPLLWLLVGGIPTNPSEEYEFVTWNDEIPNIWKNNPFMFQTTNQWWIIMIFPIKEYWVRQWNYYSQHLVKIKNVPNHQPDEVDEVDVSIRFSVELSQTLAGHKWYVTMVLTNHILVETHMYAQVNRVSEREVTGKGKG